MNVIQNYINGNFVDPIENNWIDNYNPSIGKVYGKIPNSSTKDLDLAIDAAKDAFELWSNLSANERANYLFAIAQKIDENIDELAMAESIDNGKPYTLAQKVDIPRARDNMKFFASAIMNFASESHQSNSELINYTLRKPIGVVACISPWNLPLYLFTWKIAPALAAGNTVIAKPSEITPQTAYLLAKICKEVNLPKGVINIIHGDGKSIGNPIISHPQITAISFTGGTVTGKHIASIAAPMLKKMSLELGGKNPNIIFDDCDLEKAIKTSVLSSFSNQGQICLCGSRIFVQSGIYENFKSKFIEKVNALKVGNPLSADTKIGAIVSKPHFEKVLSYIQLAKEEGGKILCGGHAIQLENELEQGWYIAPTVIENLAYDCRTNMEEIFGPVVTLMPFDTEDEVIKMANATEYGLAASIWTEHISRANRMANQIKCGIIWINCWLERDLRTPFGGMKQSGIGREGGWEALRFFTEPKNICIKY